MRLLRATKERLVFHLTKREKHLLLIVLELYPCVPPAHARLTKSSKIPGGESSQRLLDEALAEHRAENKKQLDALLAAPRRFRDTAGGCEFSLAVGDFEWLLQILNDIRVGSWVRLGAPEEKIEVLTEQNVPDLWAMELAGAFQMQLLGAMEGA